VEIRRLERIEEVPPPGRRAWGPRQRLILLGTLTALAAAGVAFGLYLTRPRPPKPPHAQQVRNNIERLSLVETFALWEMSPRALEDVPPLERQRYQSALAACRRWMAVAVVIGVLGLACAASSLLVPEPRPGGQPDGPVPYP